MKELQTRQLDSIRNVLCLRYDPHKRVSGKLGPQDFTEIDYKGDIAQRVESIIRNEIKKQAAGAKKIAVPMGSGIDSTLILTLAKDVVPHKNICAISLSFNDPLDETEGAGRICSALGIEFHKVVVDNVLADLPLQVSIVGEPRWNLWYFYVLQAAKRLGVSRVLTGDGGDELFAGYVFRYSKYLDLLSSLPPGKDGWDARAWSYLQCHERDWVPDQKDVFGTRMKTFDWQEILRYMKPYFHNNLQNKLSQVFLADYDGKLAYDWIPTNGALSRHFGIKTATPILSRLVIKYATHIPVARKYDERTQEGKLVLKEILERRDIMRYVSRKKIGFGMDLVNLWHKHGRMMAEKYLDDPVICNKGLVSKEWLETAMSALKNKQDPRYINKIMQIFSLEMWYRIFVKKDFSPAEKLE